MAKYYSNRKEVDEHFAKLAPAYDQVFEFLSSAHVNFIQHFVSLSRDDQLVDIGGGTALTSLRIHSDLEMTNPVVCVDPCEEMLKVAGENGAITIHSTAEDFLSSGKPEFPLKVVLILGCLHHFDDIDLVFSKLAEYMPDNGICLVLAQPAKTTMPLFRAARQAFTDKKKAMRRVLNIKGFQGRAISGTESVQLNKEFWYNGLRGRCISGFERFSDEDIEQGIKELEEEFSNEDILKFGLDIEGVLLQKSKDHT